MKKKLFALLVFIMFTIPTIIQANAFTENNNSRERINGYRITTIHSPRVILDCFSFFYLNVTIEKGYSLPFFANIFVYLYIPDEEHGNKISLIGYKPIVLFPAREDKISISIPCLTTNRLFYWVTCFKSGVTEDFKLKDGYIGVKIVKIRRAGIESLFWGMIWNVYFKFITKNIPRLLSSTLPPIKMMYNINLLKLLMMLKMWKEIYNPSIKWEEVKVSSPWVSSDKIKFKVVKHSNKTKGKEFKVTVKIENQLDHEVRCGVLVDVAS